MEKKWDAKSIGDKLGVDWKKVPLSQFKQGLKVELEHGKVRKRTDVTHDSALKTGKIALAHLLEFKDYYSRLSKMEKKAKSKKKGK